ncbi:MAG: hypothetical protein E6I87_15110 [Chloroflexi bacterium]|nr:MAG: hypothetical protein E6I87_15110 [Chloroflexota bacterium]
MLASVQGLPTKTPLASVELKLTVPVGVVLVPTSVSLTVAVHVARTPTVSASHPTVVDVERLVTLTVVLPADPLCVLSPPYVAVMVCVPLPTALGVYVTEQEDELPEPLSVQGLPLNVPALSEAKLTVPVGVDAVPAAVSLTVAVQVVLAPTGTLVGVQLTLVEVERLATATAVVPLEVACVLSPL